MTLCEHVSDGLTPGGEAACMLAGRPSALRARRHRKPIASLYVPNPEISPWTRRIIGTLGF
jgi:hypothetical protein